MKGINEIRSEFPILKNNAYLDIAFGNPMANSVKEAMNNFLILQQNKGVSIARDQAYIKLNEAREKFSNLIGAKSTEIAFVKNTSEGLNIAANGIKFRTGDNVVINELEHLNNSFCWLRLREKGVETRIVPQKNGRIGVDDIESFMDSRTKVVAIASTTNLGFRFDLKRLGKLCQDNSTFLVVDAIQSLGIEPLDVTETGISMLSSSAHKGLLGPHGIGFFYCSDKIIEKVSPMNVARTSYSNIEQIKDAKLKQSAEKFEGGNYNYVGAYGASVGLSIITNLNMQKVCEHSFKLSEQFRDGLLSLGIDVANSEIKKERSHIVVFSVPETHPEKVKRELGNSNITVSAHYGIVRASFAAYNTKKEVEKTLLILENIVKNIKT